MSDQLKGVAITMLGVLIIVPDSLLIRLIDAPAMTIVFWRSGISCLVMGTYLLASRTPLGPFSKAALLFAVTEAIGTLLFVIALENTSVAATLFLVSTSPIFAALLSRLKLGETLSKRMVFTIVGALIGIAVIATGSSDGNPNRLVGDLAALGVALSLAVAFTTVRHSPELPVVPALTLAYVIATSVAAFFAVDFVLVGREWLWIALNGGLFVPLGFALMAIGPRYITSAEVSLILLLEAVLAPLLVWAVLGENPGTRVLVGGGIVLTVLFVSNLIALRRRRAQK